jgi:hypoxanthine phosphoribosyltransferase
LTRFSLSVIEKTGDFTGLERLYETERGVGLRLLYSSERISAEVSRLAAAISTDYGKETLLLIVVLKGAFFFAADLARQIRCPIEMDFVKLVSYRGTQSTGTVEITKDYESAVTGRHVLVVEDIVDTGLSLAFLLERLQSEQPRSIRVCTLLDKKGHREVDIVPDYTGIVCENGFLVGYGLDLDEQYRQLPAIYEVIL